MSVQSFYRIAFAALMATAPPLHAQSTGTIAGRVMSASTGTPIVGAFILVDGGAPKARTDVDGRYRVAGVAAGTHTVDARRGTATATIVVNVASGATATADFTLRDAPPVLAAVTVIGTRTDLDETRERAALVPGAVTVVGPDEIRATRQANLKDVLQFTPASTCSRASVRRTKARSPSAAPDSATTSTRAASTSSSTGCRIATPTASPTSNRWSC